MTKKREKNKYGKSVYRSAAMITQFGIHMIVPIAMCFFVGICLDRWLGTSFLMIVLFFVGAMAGFRNIYMFSKRIFEQPSDTVRQRHVPRAGEGTVSGQISRVGQETVSGQISRAGEEIPGQPAADDGNEKEQSR